MGDADRYTLTASRSSQRLMAACDIMLASETAVFGMPEIDVGLAGGAAMLNQFFSKSFTRRLMFTGDRLPASELYRLGIIDFVWPADQLVPEAMKMAERIASKSPLRIKHAKTSCNLVELIPPKDAYRFEQNFTYELSKTEDALEARRAQLEKRKPSSRDASRDGCRHRKSCFAEDPIGS